jgi:hypothetical protein
VLDCPGSAARAPRREWEATTKGTGVLAAALLLATAAAAEVRAIEALGIRADMPPGATIAKHPLEKALERPGAMIQGAGYMVSVVAS